MRRFLFALLLSVSLVAAGCGSDDDNGSSSGTTVKLPTFADGSVMADIQARGKLKVGTKYTQLGSGLKNPTTGKLEGFDIEIAKLVAAEIFGVSAADAEKKITFSEAPTPQREFILQKKEVDIIVATYTINATRKQAVDFAGPYVIDGQTVMVKSDNTTIKTLADLNGKKVCTVRNSTTPANLTAKDVDAELTLYDSYPECSSALRQGRVDAFVTDRGILLGQAEQNKGQFKILPIEVSQEPLGIGLNKGDNPQEAQRSDAFRTFLNDTLEKIFANGAWAKAYAATLGKLGLDTPTPPTVDRYAGTGPATVVATTGVTAAPTTTSTTAKSSSSSTTPTSAY